MLLTALLFSNQLLAENLCDGACTVVITFPDGGYIKAIEPLNIDFGNSGLVDTVDTITSYNDSDTIQLAAGEQIDFGAGGSFDLGESGNIDASNIEIDSSGEINLTALEESTVLYLPNITIIGGASLNITDGSGVYIKELDNGDGVVNISSGWDEEQSYTCPENSDGSLFIGAGGSSEISMLTDFSCGGQISISDSFSISSLSPIILEQTSSAKSQGSFDTLYLLLLSVLLLYFPQYRARTKAFRI